MPSYLSCIRIFRTLVLFCFSTTCLLQAEVKVASNGLNASFQGLTLEEALGEIVDATDIEITTSQVLDKKVLTTFTNISAEQLIKRLLHGYNAIYLQHPATGQLQAVRIFASSNAKPIPAMNNPQQKQITDQNKAQETDGKYYMTITLNGLPVKMLVDTGANTMALSQALALQLNLHSGKATIVNTAGGQTRAYRTIVESVVMAGKELKGVQAVILPDLQETGLIGQNVLSHYKRITENGKMQFEPLTPTNLQQGNNTVATGNQTKTLQGATNNAARPPQVQSKQNKQQQVTQQPKATATTP